jgi:Tol biopolymer transport system component
VFDGTFGDDSHLVMLDLASGTTRTMTSEKGWQMAPRISPDGTRVAYLTFSGEKASTWLMPIDGSAPATLVRSGQSRPSWSPDGRALWAGRDSALERVDVATNETGRRLPAPVGSFLTTAVELPDGRVFTRRYDKTTHGGAGILRYDPGNDTPVEVYKGDLDETVSLAPDGEHLLFSKVLETDHRELWQLPVDGGPPTSVGDAVVAPTKGLAIAASGDRIAWSTCTSGVELSIFDDAREGPAPRLVPLFERSDWTDKDPAGVPGDGKGIVVVSDRSGSLQLWVLDLTGRAAPRRIATDGLAPEEPTVSPDGRWIAFSAVEHGVWVVPFDGSAPAQQVGARSTDNQAAFGRDSTLVYFSRQTPDRRAIVAVPREGGEPVTVVEHARLPAVSPRGDEIVYLTDEDDGELRVMDLGKKTTRALLPGTAKGIHYAHYSADGTRLAVANGLTELLELDGRTHAVGRRLPTGDQAAGMTYVGKRLVVARSVWRGHLWTATLGDGEPGRR